MFHNRRLAQGQQEAVNTLPGEAAEALIALAQAATTTATTTRAQGRAETTPQFVIPKRRRLHSIVIENNLFQNGRSIPIPPLEEIEAETEDEEELEECEIPGRRSITVEDMARDMGATPAHKRTKVPTKTALDKKRGKSPPHCRREPEHDKFFMPPPPPPPAVLITDTPINDHVYCTNCNQEGQIKIMCPFHLKKTCRKCGQPGHNIITCGRLPKKAVRPRNLKSLREHTAPTRGPGNLHLIQQYKVGNFCSLPTPDNFQRLTHRQLYELCKCYGHQTKNCYITHRNRRNTFQSSNQKTTLRANQPLQLELDTEIEPDHSIAQWMVNNQVYQEYEVLVRRHGKWSAIFRTLLPGAKITRAKVVDDYLYLLHKYR